MPISSFIKRFLVVTAAFLGSLPAWSAPQITGNNEVPILVSLAGLGSCDASIGSRALLTRTDELARKLARQNGNAVFLYACFGPNAETLSVYSSRGPSTWWQSSIRQLTNVVVELAQRIEAEEGKQAAVHLLGHSYGGYLAMRLALALPESLKPRYLATVDPISLVGCPASSFVQSLAMSERSGSEAVAGCVSAPHDLRPSYDNIAGSVDYWENFYQDNFGYLHSEDIPVAEANYRVTIGRNHASAHWLIADDTRVWRTINRSVLSRNLPE